MIPHLPNNIYLCQHKKAWRRLGTLCTKDYISFDIVNKKLALGKGSKECIRLLTNNSIGNRSNVLRKSGGKMTDG